MIPKILHFTWKSEEDLKNRFIHIDERGKMSLQECVDTFRAKNPEWDYRFYSDADIDKFVLVYYPHFYLIYKGLKKIEQIDLFRYMCLFKYGGVFLDTDCICIRPLDEALQFFPNAELITCEEMLHESNWVNYPPHKQLNLWSIFCSRKNHHMRNILAHAIGNCLIAPDMPVIEKTSMAVLGDYIYKAAKADPTVLIVSSSYFGLDGRVDYLHRNGCGFDGIPPYILHGYHGSWIDDDFKKYADLMNTRDAMISAHGSPGIADGTSSNLDNLESAILSVPTNETNENPLSSGNI